MTASPVRVARLPVVATLLALAACGGTTDVPRVGAPEGIPVATPAAEGSSRPYPLVAGSRLHLLWIEPAGDDARALRIATRQGDAWSEPRTIHVSPAMLASWADFPSLAAGPEGRVLAAHWLESQPEGAMGYEARVALSSDGGATWSAPARPHEDTSPAEHGFVSLVPSSGPATRVLWLDGRNMEATGTTQLMYRRVGPEAMGPEIVVDEDVCNCCQTSAAPAGERMAIAWRDHDAGHVRDIKLALLGPDGEVEPLAVPADGWALEYCPVNGPALAIDGERLALAWFTAAADRPRVLLGLGNPDEGVTDRPQRLDDGAPEGRVDVAWLEDGSAVVSWVERAGERAEVRLRRLLADGTLESPIVAGLAQPGRQAGFPRIAATGRSVWVAWTEPGPPDAVRLVRVDFAG